MLSDELDNGGASPNGLFFIGFVLLKKQHDTLVAVEVLFFFFVEFGSSGVVVAVFLKLVFVGTDADGLGHKPPGPQRGISV